jgi:hypothetical protein
VRPRLSFAAPFVVVLGCRRPIAEPEPPEPQDAATVASITDAIAEADRRLEPDAPPDAAPPPPRIDCSDPRSHCTHNPPRLDYCADHPGVASCPPLPPSYCRQHPDKVACQAPCSGSTPCNPPGPVMGRVINTEVSSGDVIVTVSVGSEQGVTKQSHGWLQTSSKHRVPGELLVIRISKRTSIWRARVSLDVVRDNPNVEIQPP